MKRKYKSSKVKQPEDTLTLTVTVKYTLPAECVTRHFENKYKVLTSEIDKYDLIHAHLMHDGNGDLYSGLCENEIYPPDRDNAAWEIVLELNAK